MNRLGYCGQGLALAWHDLSFVDGSKVITYQAWKQRSAYWKDSDFRPFVLSCLERNVHQKLIISGVMCKVCLGEWLSDCVSDWVSDFYLRASLAMGGTTETKFDTTVA